MFILCLTWPEKKFWPGSVAIKQLMQSRSRSCARWLSACYWDKPLWSGFSWIVFVQILQRNYHPGSHVRIKLPEERPCGSRKTRRQSTDFHVVCAWLENADNYRRFVEVKWSQLHADSTGLHLLQSMLDMVTRIATTNATEDIKVVLKRDDDRSIEEMRKVEEHWNRNLLEGLARSNICVTLIRTRRWRSGWVWSTHLQIRF